MKRKCHNCAGTGILPTKKSLRKHPEMLRKGICYYCRGKGFRTNYYGRDKNSKYE